MVTVDLMSAGQMDYFHRSRRRGRGGTTGNTMTDLLRNARGISEYRKLNQSHVCYPSFPGVFILFHVVELI